MVEGSKLDLERRGAHLEHGARGPGGLVSGFAPHSRCVDCRHWEMLLLYTVWTNGTRKQQVFAVVHCTVGDAMIAGHSLLVARALLARTPWPSGSAARVYAASLAFGVGYTIYSEWLNTGVRGSWAHSDLMPVAPVIGTGLAP